MHAHRHTQAHTNAHTHAHTCRRLYLSSFSDTLVRLSGGSLQMPDVTVPQIGVGVFHAWLFHDGAGGWVSEVFVSTDARRACPRSVIVSTVGAYPRGTGSNPVEGNGPFFSPHTVSSIFRLSLTHTHTHTHTHMHAPTIEVTPTITMVFEGRSCHRVKGGSLPSAVGAQELSSHLAIVFFSSLSVVLFFSHISDSFFHLSCPVPPRRHVKTTLSAPAQTQAVRVKPWNRAPDFLKGHLLKKNKESKEEGDFNMYVYLEVLLTLMPCLCLDDVIVNDRLMS